MIEHGKTRVWRLDDLLPANEPERGQPVVRDDRGSAERRVEAQRVVVIQPNTPAPLEHEEPRRVVQHAQQTGPRARHTAEAWAAGANIGAKTELRRNDAEIMKAVAQARARRTEEASASSIVIPKMPAVAKLAQLKVWVLRQPKPRLLIAGGLTLALGLVPLLLRASGDAPQVDASEHFLAPAPLRAAKQDSSDDNEAAQPPRLTAAAARVSAQASEAARSTAAPHASPEADEVVLSTQLPGTVPRGSAEGDEAARSAQLRAAAEAAPIGASEAAGSTQLQAAPAAATHTAATPVPSMAAGNVTPRAAIDALISGNPSLAAARYQTLARSHPERAELAVAARILREEAERAARSGE